ncbi:hypothetical protein LWI29_006642 [Acer saccharum]|uniref:Uncharacterized protein n=1 Tax=Acer saccharum TaxID=4024 RepID=A0AA39SWP3_ACESA|nr:hypothetical protein LWI29_006642 [Acer saccharum]
MYKSFLKIGLVSLNIAAQLPALVQVRMKELGKKGMMGIGLLRKEGMASFGEKQDREDQGIEWFVSSSLGDKKANEMVEIDLSVVLPTALPTKKKCTHRGRSTKLHGMKPEGISEGNGKVPCNSG